MPLFCSPLWCKSTISTRQRSIAITRQSPLPVMAPTLGHGSSQLGCHMLRNSFYTSGRYANCSSPSASRHMLLASARSRCLPRPTASSIRTFASNSGKRPKFSQRLGEAMRNTKIQWYQIPVGLGIGFLGLVQFYKVSSREKERLEMEDGQDGTRTPKKRARIRPDGPWYANSLCPYSHLNANSSPGKSRSCRLYLSRRSLGSGVDSTN